MKFSAVRTALLAATAIAASGANFALAQDSHDSVEAWRLFVADHTQPVVRVIDFEDGKQLGRYDVKGHAALTASASGKLVYAAQSDSDIVHVIATGIDFSEHGDHSDLEVSEPALLPVSFEGKRPFHVVPEQGHAVLFYDRGGKAEVISEAALSEGKALISRVVDTTAPHHGVALTLGDYVLVSVPDTKAEVKPDALPPRLGLRVLDAKDQQIGDVATCTNLHGEAVTARVAAFGCKEGVLIARERAGDAPELTLLPYPADFPEGSTGTLLGGKALRFFLGNYGADRLVLIDPEAGDDAWKLITLPTRSVHFVLDDANPRNAYVLTEDGDLHVLDVVKGEITRKARVTEPYSKDGHWRDPRPRLAVADGQIAVTDPRHALVRVIDAESLKEVRSIAVEGQPFNIVAVGGSGAAH